MRFSDTQRLFTGKTAPLSGIGNLLQRMHIDGPMLGGLLLISGVGLVVLYSAVAQSMDLWLQQCFRLVAAIAAMLIIPAAAARPLAQTPERMAVIAGLIGMLSVLGGLFASFRFDTPTGPTIVCCATLCFALSSLVAQMGPQH